MGAGCNKLGSVYLALSLDIGESDSFRIIWNIAAVDAFGICNLFVLVEEVAKFQTSKTLHMRVRFLRLLI